MAQTAEAETAAAAQTTDKKFQLAPPRGRVKTGMPKDGLWLFSGLPKSGKTTLAASIPGAVLLELESGGADRVAGWVQEIRDMETFRQALKATIAEPEAKAIVIDTIDILLDWIEDDVAAKFGLETLSERKEGVSGFATWAEYRKRVENLVGVFKACGKLAVFLAHYKEPRLDNDGKLVIPATINAPGKIGGYICAQADAIGHCYKKQVGNETKYYTSFQGGPLGTYGSRIRELEDKTVVLPKEGQWTALEAVFKAPEKAEEPPKAKATEKGGKK